MTSTESHKSRKSRDMETAADLLFNIPGPKGEFTRHVIARSKNTDKDLLWYLSSDKSLALDIAQNPNSDEETLSRLLLEEDKDVWSSAARSLESYYIQSAKR